MGLALASARAAGHALARGCGDLGQGCLRIAKNSHRRRVVLAELPRIDVEMDECDAGRHRIDIGGQREREQVASDREQDVVFFEHLAHLRRQPDHRAAKQRMRGGKRGRARHELGVDRRADELGKLNELRMGAALCHRVAGHDHRALGGR